MADPFSVASSVISVVSLGIQVCQGLLLYYGDYKSYDDTVGSLCRKIEGLRATLEICEEALQKPGFTSSKASANVTKSIGACKDGLDSLQRMLDSCKKIPKPQGLKASIHNYGQQTLYPLKKSNVLRLQSTVAELQDNVHAALLALQTEGLIHQNSTLAIISTNLASGAKQVKDIHDGIERIERSIQSTRSVLPVLQRQGEVSSLNSLAMRDDMESIHRDMEEHQVSFSDSFTTLKSQVGQKSSTTESAILAGVDGLARQNLALMNALEQLSESSQIRSATLESDVKSIQLSLVQKPSLFRKTCDEFKSRELEDMPTSMAYRPIISPSRIRMTRTGMVCTCRFRTSSQQYSSSQNSNSMKTSWTVSLHLANIDHHHDCLYSAWEESSWSLDFRLAYCSRLLARAVQASVSFTKGAGGMSLSPTMKLRCLVASDSPAFALIRRDFPREMSTDDIETVVNQRVQSLRQMFQDRKASPYDVDIYGNTLLHVGNPR